MGVIHTLLAWDAASNEEKIRTSLLVERYAPVPTTFIGLATFRLGEQQHTIALFKWQGGELALLPGLQGSLGYQVDHVLSLIPQSETWKGQPLTDPVVLADLRRFLTTVLTPVRSVQLRPYLIERSATALEVIQAIGPNEIRFLPPPTRAETLAATVREGLRFPTSDEWEYACSGGATTLFRWGDDWPSSPWTPAYLRHPGEWREDLQPNAFGLMIAQHPQQLEYCWEPEIFRGGDGGEASTADMENYIQWLALATAFCYPLPDYDRLNYRPYLRRVMPLERLLEEHNAEL